MAYAEIDGMLCDLDDRHSNNAEDDRDAEVAQCLCYDIRSGSRRSHERGDRETIGDDMFSQRDCVLDRLRNLGS